MDSVFLVASEFPSGTTWLINFFLEIGVKVNLDGRGNNTWRPEGSRQKFILNEEKEGWKRHLPILSAQKEFSFRDDFSIRFSHEYPNPEALDKKIILVVRDGRDAIHSQFKRFSSLWSDFSAMLGELTTQIYIRPTSSFPRASYPETWALYNYLWLHSIKKGNLLVIKFEDLKTNPVSTVKKTLDFIGVERTDGEINNGIENSSFEKAKIAEEEYKKKDPSKRYAVVNRKGRPNEWKEVYTKKELKWFEGFPNFVLGEFGYETVSAIPADNGSGDVAFSSITKKELRTGLSSAGEGRAAILREGKKVLSFYWVMAMCNQLNIRLDVKDFNKAIPVFNASVRACDLMPITPYFRLEIAMALAKFGARKQSMLVLGDIRDYPETKPYLAERGKAYALNLRFFMARKDLIRAGYEDWLWVAISERIDIKRLRQSLKRLLSCLPNPLQEVFYKSLRAARKTFRKTPKL